MKRTGRMMSNMGKVIPIGVNSYQKLREEDYYTVDRSRVAIEFLERETTVTLITQPRRFRRNIADTFGIRQEAR